MVYKLYKLVISTINNKIQLLFLGNLAIQRGHHPAGWCPLCESMAARVKTMDFGKSFGRNLSISVHVYSPLISVEYTYLSIYIYTYIYIHIYIYIVLLQNHSPYSQGWSWTSASLFPGSSDNLTSSCRYTHLVAAALQPPWSANFTLTHPHGPTQPNARFAERRFTSDSAANMHVSLYSFRNC